MIHKTRAGKPIVCHPCQIEEHEYCVGTVIDGLRCHCSNCQLPCAECLGKPGAKQRFSSGSCPVHFTELPLSGQCDECA